MKVRTPGTLSAAINEIKLKLTEEKCAQLVERSTALVRKWADPDLPSVPNLRQSMILDAEYVRSGFGEPPIQGWYVKSLDKMVVKNPQNTINFIAHTLQAQAGLGNLSAAIASFTSIDSDEKETLSKNERSVLLGIVNSLAQNLDEMGAALSEKLDLTENAFHTHATYK